MLDLRPSPTARVIRKDLPTGLSHRNVSPIMFEKIDIHHTHASRRSTIYASQMVSTSQPLAAQAGLEILRAGGNAVDAAIATAVCLTVVEPTMNAIGGDAFAIVS